ncbi:MED7 protein [Teladorsagia circumcincta]|uniref:Mediator of RNA polymerase II transcription subunit 7 n=1 Tax=Teladorsagia circumcincta TaxID=45464 RepID=A0A2G9TWS1_TELCI|nr:MED7 protein [Teladorsagia circumcincta]
MTTRCLVLQLSLVRGFVSGAVLPPPPVQSVFTVFGEEYRLEDDIIRSLASQNIKQLYPTKYDWKTEMKKLNRSVVVAFLDLLDILVRCPDHPERNEKINDIQTIFINMHHLINEYRPLQARDTLRMMQSQQLKELKKTVKRFKGHLAAGKAALREELSLSDLKLTPVPRPSPLTGIDIDSDEENMPTLIKMERRARRMNFTIHLSVGIDVGHGGDHGSDVDDETCATSFSRPAKTTT